MSLYRSIIELISTLSWVSGFSDIHAIMDAALSNAQVEIVSLSARPFALRLPNLEPLR